MRREGDSLWDVRICFPVERRNFFQSSRLLITFRHLVYTAAQQIPLNPRTSYRPIENQFPAFQIDNQSSPSKLAARFPLIYRSIDGQCRMPVHDATPESCSASVRSRNCYSHGGAIFDSTRKTGQRREGCTRREIRTRVRSVTSRWQHYRAGQWVAEPRSILPPWPLLQPPSLTALSHAGHPPTAPSGPSRSSRRRTVALAGWLVG